jgi:type I restriction enzyme S subunit
MQTLLTGTRRFPGFEDHPWREVRLGDVVRLSKDRLDPRRPHNARRCIELEHIEGETGRLLGETASDKQASIKAVFEPGDILFGKLRPYLRKFVAPDFSGVCSTEIWVLKPVGSKLTSEFLHLIVQGDGFMEEASRSSGSKMPRAEWGVVADYRMMLPVVDEQKQIAAVLQDADHEVDHLTGQLDHLRTEKKSLMQQLLTGKRRVVV